MNEAPLKGRTAIVTGSGRNIGRAIALDFARQGANVVLNGFGDAAEIEKDFGFKPDFEHGKHLLEANDSAGNTFKATAKPVLIGTAVVGATTMIFSIILLLQSKGLRLARPGEAGTEPALPADVPAPLVIVNKAVVVDAK